MDKRLRRQLRDTVWIAGCAFVRDERVGLAVATMGEHPMMFWVD